VLGQRDAHTRSHQTALPGSEHDGLGGDEIGARVAGMGEPWSVRPGPWHVEGLGHVTRVVHGRGRIEG